MKNESRQKKVLIIIIAILLIANIVTLVMLIQKPQHRMKSQISKKGNLTNYLKKELNFSDNQLKSYDSLLQIHKDSIKSISDNIEQKKRERFSRMANAGFSDTAILESVDNNLAQQKVLEIKILRHLRNVREIATPIQQQKFDTGFVSYMRKVKQGKIKRE